MTSLIDVQLDGLMNAMAATQRTIRVFVPVGHASDAGAPAPAGAKRDGTSPLAIGLLDNHKHNTGKVLDQIEHRLQERYEGIRVVRAQKPEAGKGAPPELLEALARDCQAVVNGIGD